MYGRTFSYRRGVVLPFILAALLATALSASARAAITQDEQALLSSISIDRMVATIERLCSDEFKGRRAGSPESYAAADYIAEQFKDCGLSAPECESFEGYRQPLTMRYSLIGSIDDIRATLTYPVNGALRTKTFAYRGYNGAGGLDLRGQVVFVGYGIHNPTAGYDDYAGLDVKGKIVLWQSGQPAGVKLTTGVTGAHKMVTAYQRGAVACLISRPANIKDEWGTNVGLSGTIADFPYIAVDEKVTKELFAAPTLARSGLPGTEVRLQITPVCDPKRKTYNVIGVIPGTDPDVTDQIVMVGAHYDHLGSKGGEIYRGADDNASGAAAMLEIARIIRDTGLAPRRTMVFSSWTGEESGLIGSNHFAANPPFSLKRVVSNLEFDMVGQGNPGTFITTGSAFLAHYATLSGSAEELGISLKAERYPGASDYLAFTRKGVPSSLIYADGEHPHYHTSRDTPSAINRDVLTSAARLGALAAWRAANQ